MSNLDWNKKAKYIVGSVGAAALVATSCFAGAGVEKKAQPGRNYLAGETMTATDTDAQTFIHADELADELADSIHMEEKEVDKDETVYVFADANGAVDHILVNETLKNREQKATLQDRTELTDIVNVKGDETFTQDGNTITWDAAGHEISYQGMTDKELPVTVKATYYLDGQEIAPEELAGKSGHVKIRMDYTSNESVTKEVNGKEETIDIPFVAVTGMILGDNFSNISVENGKYIAQGENNLVVGYAIPGLIDDVHTAAEKFDTEIPQYVEVSADVTDFSLDMTVTLLVNGSEMNFSGGVDLENLDALTADLSSAGDQLASGSGELSEGANTLADKMGELTSGAGSLKAGMDSLSSKSGDLESGIAILDASAQNIAAGINALDAAVNTEMTDAEKQQIANTVSAAVAPTIEAGFAPGTENYNTIYNQAAGAYEANITGATDAIYQAYLSSEAYAAFLDSVCSSKAAQIANATVVSKMTEAASNGVALTVEQYNAIYTEAYNTAYAQVAANPTVVQTVQGAFYAMAEQTTTSLAAAGKDAIGMSVVAACKEAAVTAATTAAAQSAVQGAETAKKTIASRIEAVQPNGYSLVSGANAMAQGTSQLSGSVPALKEGINQLVNGANALKNGATLLSDGANQVADGAGTLNESLISLNQDAIRKMVQAYNGDVKDAVFRLQAAMEAATEYDSFAGIADGDSGVTRFIIKTAAISAE